MPTIRVEHNTNYSVMSNYHFRDKTLSWKAKGILSTMLSLPEGWDYSIKGLTELSNDGETATRTALKELEEHGYLYRHSVKEKGKIVDWEYVVYEFPHVENPHVENPQLENTAQLNTKELNTQKTNTKQLEEKEKEKEVVEQAVNYLNEKTGKRFRSNNDKTVRLITALINKKYTLDDIKQVIDTMCSKWLHDVKMVDYLRPETLFGTKFEGYLNMSVSNGYGSLNVDEAFNKAMQRTYSEDFWGGNDGSK